MGKFKKKQNKLNTSNSKPTKLTKKTLGKSISSDGGSNFIINKPKPVNLITSRTILTNESEVNNSISQKQSHKSKNTKDISLFSDDQMVRYRNKIIDTSVKLNYNYVDNVSKLPLDKLKILIKNKSIALVASSSELLNHRLGLEIDSHDIVVRFNSYKILPVSTGVKTTIHSNVYLNTFGHDRYSQLKLIISNNLDRWVKTVSNYDHIKYGTLIEYSHHQHVNDNKFETNPLTTGLNTLFMFLFLGGYELITLYGFNLYDGGVNSILRVNSRENNKISRVHNYDYERRLLDNLSDYNHGIKKIIYGNSSL